jgi:hypothetical protein
MPIRQFIDKSLGVFNGKKSFSTCASLFLNIVFLSGSVLCVLKIYQKMVVDRF